MTNFDKSIKHINVVLGIILMVVVTTVSADSKHIRYINITQYDVYDGLVGNKVTQLGQDDEGYIWIGTHGGLSRFDSQNFTNFKQDTLSANSLPANEISLFHLVGKEMWISLNDVGLAHLDIEKNEFSMIPESPGQPNGIEHSVIFAIASDNMSRVWIFQFDHGISVYDPVTQTYQHYTPQNSPWMSSVRFFDAKKDHNGHIWVATLEGKVFKIDPTTRSGTEYQITYDEQDAKTARMYSISISPDNQVIASGYQGVYKLNRSTNQFEVVISDQHIIDLMGKRYTVRSVMADSQNNLWLATRGALLLYKDNQLTQVKFIQKGKPVLSDILLRGVYEDKEGNIWLATDENGVVKLNPGWNAFDIYLPFLNPEGVDNKIHSILSDHGKLDDTFWVNNKVSNDIIGYRYQKGQIIQSKVYDSSHQLPEAVLEIYQDSDYRLWVTSINGLHVFDRASNVFIPIDSFTFNGGVRGMFEVGEKIYFGVYGDRQLYSVDRESLTVSKHQELNNEILNDIFTASDGSIWVAGNRGLDVFDTSSLQFTTKIATEEGFNSVWIDEENHTVWLVSNGKVLKYKNIDGNLIAADTSRINSQVSSDHVDSIKLFNNQIWLGSNHGVIVFDGLTDQLLMKLQVDNNLPSNEVIGVLQMYDQSIMVFTDTGIVHLNRALEKHVKTQPVIKLTQVMINDQISESLSELSYNYGSLTFTYQLFSYATPNLHQYQYKLYPDSDWVSVKQQNSQTFHQLMPGQYHFQVRGRNDQQPWSEAVGIEFTVLPPPWESQTAYLLYGFAGLLFLSSVFYLYRKRWQYNATIEQAKEKQAFAETQLTLTTSLVSSLAIDELLEKIKQQIKDKVGANHVEVCYWNSQKHYQIFSNKTLDTIKKNELGAKAMSMFEANQHHELETLTTGSRLWILFSHSADRLGLIQLKRFKGNFNKKDITLAMAYATQSSLALENARLFEEVNHLAEQANASNKAKSDFLAQVSHEVRTPMNGILGMNELLLDTELSEEQRLYASAVAESGEHLLHIINDILDLSKIEAGELILESRPVNLHQLTDEVVKSFVSISKNKKLLFWFDFSANIQPVRLGDSIRLKQVMMNLLSNAFKFTSSGEVSLVLQPCDGADMIQLTVNDTGIGIESSLLDKLFEPFSQADSSITRKYGGTGLGLSIVKQLVEKMGGYIEIMSEPSMGTSVSCFLPLEVVSREMAVKQKQSVTVYCHHQSLKAAICHALKINGAEVVASDQFNHDAVFVIDNENQDYNEVIKQANRNLVPVYLLKPVYCNETYQSGTYCVLDLPCTLARLGQLFEPEFDNNQLNSTIRQSNKKLHLLVVEDNGINQQLLLELLEKDGHIVDIFDDANHALAGIEKSNYEMLLVDYHLPDLTGIEFILACREVGVDSKAIIMTADVSRELKSLCHEYGIHDIITKPFKMAELVEVINKG